MLEEVSFHAPSVPIVWGNRLPAKSLKIPKSKNLPNFDGAVLRIRGSWKSLVWTYRCMWGPSTINSLSFGQLQTVDHAKIKCILTKCFSFM